MLSWGQRGRCAAAVGRMIGPLPGSGCVGGGGVLAPVVAEWHF